MIPVGQRKDQLFVILASIGIGGIMHDEWGAEAREELKSSIYLLVEGEG